MSRITEALRRAGEQSEPAAADFATDAAVEERDVESLTSEPYPIEIGERRKLRTPGAAEPVVQPPAPIAAAPFSATSEAPAQPAPRPVFDRIDARLAEKVVVDANMSVLSREQYRRLSAMLHDAQGTSGLRVVMIASAAPAEGKTLTAANVALTLSDSYRKRVLLIDADLRKPTLHQTFRLDVTIGLTDGLDGQGDARLVVRQVSSHLWVLPAGRPTFDPIGVLTSARMRRLLEEAKETFDWVIIDTPPLVMLPDAHLLASMVDGAVLVVRANSTPHDLVKRAADIIGRNRITGVVLNRADARVQPTYGTYTNYDSLPTREALER